MTLTNTGSSAWSSWTAQFTLPDGEKITNAWNATVGQSGTGVTAGNLSYNATVAPGGSASFGYQATWTTSSAAPASFTVNKTACTVN
ncbi:cellulose binding domain-containing protein [Streptacidiphilus monticola]